jgi:hypothetical protein
MHGRREYVLFWIIFVYNRHIGKKKGDVVKVKAEDKVVHADLKKKTAPMVNKTNIPTRGYLND